MPRYFGPRDAATCVPQLASTSHATHTTSWLRRALAKGGRIAPFLLAVAVATVGAGQLPGQAWRGPIPKRPTTQPATDIYGDPLPVGAVARMGSVRLRHAGLSDCLILPDGKTLITTGGSRVRFWDLPTGRLLRQVKLEGEGNPGSHTSLTPDRKLLSGVVGTDLILWDPNSGKQIKTVHGLPEHIEFATLSPDAHTVALGITGRRIDLCEVRTGAQRAVPLPTARIGDDSTFHCTFSPDGKLLACGGGWGEVLCVYDVRSNHVLQLFRCDASTSTFSPDSKRLIVASMAYNGARGTNIRVFEMRGGKETAHYALGHDDSYFALALSADGKTLACGFSDQSCLLDITTGRVLQRFPGRLISVWFTPDGKTLVGSRGNRVSRWDVATGKLLGHRPGDFGWQPALALSPNGRTLAAADWMDPSVALWDTTDGRLLRQLPLQGEKRYVRDLGFTPDGKTLVASQYKGFVQFWDVRTGREQRTLQLQDPTQRNPDLVYFITLHVSSDGRHISTLEQVYAPSNGMRLASWNGTSGKLLSHAPVPSQSRLHAWTDDGEAVWLPMAGGLQRMQAETGAITCRIPDAGDGEALAVSPDGRLVAAPKKGPANASAAHSKKQATVGIWEAATGKEIAAVPAGRVSHLALANDNRHLLTVDAHFLRLWDLATGHEQGRWTFPDGSTAGPDQYAVTGLLLTPDSRRAFTSLADGTALLWDVESAYHDTPLTARPPDQKQLAAWWADLADDDASRAYAALWRLTEWPEASVPWLSQHLKPAGAANEEEIQRAITNLDGKSFTVREKASARLRSFGEQAEPALRQALQRHPSLEARRRIQQLLDNSKRQPLVGETLQAVRALQVLEHAHTHTARGVLQELAHGMPDARFTREAKAALDRLNRQAPQ